MNDLRVPGPAPKPGRPDLETGAKSAVPFHRPGGARCVGTVKSPRSVTGACKFLPGRGKRFQSLAG